MIGDDPPLLVAHHPLLLEAGDQPIDRRLEIEAVHFRLVVARGEQRGLVDQVREIGAGEPGGPLRDHLEVDVGTDLHALDVNAEDRLAPLHVRLVDQHLPVEAARAEQRRVEHLRPVGRAHDDDALARVEAVHLGEQLVQRLLALLVAAERALGPRLAERVELVDEDDAGRLGFGLLEQIANPGGADADEHLDELRAAHREERDVRFAGDRARQQRLAGARRPDQQHTLGNPSAQVGVFLRVLQELDDLLELVLRLFHSRHVLEAHLHFVVGVDLRLAAGEGHHAAFGARHAAEEEAPDADEEQQRDDPAEQLGQPAVHHLAGVLHALGFELLGQLGILDPRHRERLGLGVAGLEGAADRLIADRDLGHLAVLHELLELGVGKRAARRRHVVRLRDAEHEQQREAVPQRRRGTRRQPAGAASIAAARIRRSGSGRGHLCSALAPVS